MQRAIFCFYLSKAMSSSLVAMTRWMSLLSSSNRFLHSTQYFWLSWWIDLQKKIRLIKHLHKYHGTPANKSLHKYIIYIQANQLVKITLFLLGILGFPLYIFHKTKLMNDLLTGEIVDSSPSPLPAPSW